MSIAPLAASSATEKPNAPAGETSPTVVASFRFYEELNDFLAADRRRREFEVVCASHATVKHLIEALGVPHTEVELILVNGVSVDFAQRVQDGDRISVYPKFESLDIRPLLRLRPNPSRITRFVADAHLGALARLLRMAGFDTLYDHSLSDAEIAQIAERDERIVLTRDRDLLRRRRITRGCYVCAQQADAQLSEIIGRLDLVASLRPLSLCLRCNARLTAVAPESVLDSLPLPVRERPQELTTCEICHRVFWEGSHSRHMRERLARAVEAARDAFSRDP